MLICGVASAATAVNRWLVAYRELVRRHEAAAPLDVLPQAIASPGVAPRVLIPSHVHKVAPLEQH